MLCPTKALWENNSSFHGNPQERALVTIGSDSAVFVFDHDDVQTG